MMMMMMILLLLLFINCNWVITRWQWLYYIYTKLYYMYTKLYYMYTRTVLRLNVHRCELSSTEIMCFDEKGSVQEGKRQRHTQRAGTHSSDFKALLGFNPVTFTKGQNAMTLSCRFCMREV